MTNRASLQRKKQGFSARKFGTEDNRVLRGLEEYDGGEEKAGQDHQLEQTSSKYDKAEFHSPLVSNQTHVAQVQGWANPQAKATRGEGVAPVLHAWRVATCSRGAHIPRRFRPLCVNTLRVGGLWRRHGRWRDSGAVRQNLCPTGALSLRNTRVFSVPDLKGVETKPRP